MKYYDVTLTISPELPVWPGDPLVEIERIEKIENGADANVSKVSMGVHTGTHVDAPFHFLQDGIKLTEIALKTFFGKATVVEIPHEVDRIDSDVLDRLDKDVFTERILFKTRNSGYWGEKPARFHKDFVGIDDTGARCLVQNSIKLVGIDYLSIAPFDDSTAPHQILLKAGVVIVEGLDLSAVEAGIYDLYCLPLKLRDVEGAPARVLLIKN